MTGVFDMFDVLYEVLPPWAVVAVFTVTLIAILPLWYRWVRSKQVKGILRSLASTSDTTQKRYLTEQLWKRVGTKSSLLTTTALSAKEMGLPRIRSIAEEQLAQMGLPQPPYPIKESTPNGPEKLHPIEIEARVKQLLNQGLESPAQELVRSGLERYPGDKDLVTSQQLIDAYRSSSATIPTPSQGGTNDP